MDLTVYLLIIGMSIVSARHTLDVNTYLVQSETDPNHRLSDRYSAQVVERRNVDGDVPVSVKQSIYNQQQQNVDYSYATESDHVALISEKVDASNNIGNDDNQFKLRTNAYPTKGLEITEYTTQSINEHIQTGHSNLDEKNIHNRHGSEVSSHETHSDGSNKQFHRPVSGPNSRGVHVSKNHRTVDKTPETRFVPQEIQVIQFNGESSNTNYHGVNVKTNQRTIPDSTTVQKTNTESAYERPIDSSIVQSSSNRSTANNRGAGESARLPKEKEEEEIPWVWGSEPELKASTTDADDLIDRAAFDGKLCPSGLVKVMDMCVEEH